MLQYVFWELAWDVCRTGYGSCNEGQDIIQTGAQAFNAKYMVNGMYAYALSATVMDDKVADFMSNDSDGYFVALHPSA